MHLEKFFEKIWTSKILSNPLGGNVRRIPLQYWRPIGPEYFTQNLTYFILHLKSTGICVK
jgi:hypothetical protein